MRDMHLVDGKKKSVIDIDEAHTFIKDKYPDVQLQGSVFTYSWLIGDTVVGEAWMDQKGRWWVRRKFK